MDEKWDEGYQHPLVATFKIVYYVFLAVVLIIVWIIALGAASVSRLWRAK